MMPLLIDYEIETFNYGEISKVLDNGLYAKLVTLFLVPPEIKTSLHSIRQILHTQTLLKLIQPPN